MDDSLDYLRSLAQNPELVALPLVVLDVVSAEAANSIQGLSVFPCFISDGQEQISQLCPVISIAASQFNH